LPLNTNWLILIEGLPERILRGPVPVDTIRFIIKLNKLNNPNYFWGISHSERVLLIGSEPWLESCVYSLEEGEE
jgi:hypothetical protein